MPRHSKTLTPAAMAGFLAALRGGALVVAAARAAGVAVSTLYWWRKRDAVFASAWACAVALSAGAPGRRLPFDGRRRRRFLVRFERSCNARSSCAEAGVHPATLYRHIGRDPGFERDCRTALGRGGARLVRELAAERAARARRWARHRIVPRGEVTRDFDEAMKLLARWERPDGSIGPRRVRPGRMRRWSFDEAIALLAKRLRAMEPGWGDRAARGARQIRRGGALPISPFGLSLSKPSPSPRPREKERPSTDSGRTGWICPTKSPSARSAPRPTARRSSRSLMR